MVAEGRTHTSRNIEIPKTQDFGWCNADEAGRDRCADTVGFCYYGPLIWFSQSSLVMSQRWSIRVRLTINGSCSNVCHGTELSGSGMTLSSSALSSSRDSGLLSKWNVNTANVCAVVSPPAPTKMKPSSMSLSMVFSCGGRSLSRSSSNIVLCVFCGSRFRAKTFSTCLRTSYLVLAVRDIDENAP